MLDRCFVRPETLDRIRSSWLGPLIERYSAWLCERGYQVSTLATRVSVVRQFGTFAQTHGAQGYEQLPAHLEPFLHFWIHQPHPRRTSDRSPQAARTYALQSSRCCASPFPDLSVGGVAMRYASRSRIGLRGFRSTSAMSGGYVM